MCNCHRPLQVVNLVIGSSLRLSEVTVTDLRSLERSREATQKFNQRYERLGHGIKSSWKPLNHIKHLETSLK